MEPVNFPNHFLLRWCQKPRGCGLTFFFEIPLEHLGANLSFTQPLTWGEGSFMILPYQDVFTRRSKSVPQISPTRKATDSEASSFAM